MNPKRPSYEAPLPSDDAPGPNADFPPMDVPKEWAEDYSPPSFIGGNLFGLVMDELDLPRGFGEMERLYCSKDSMLYQDAYKLGWRPARLASGARQPYRRPNIDGKEQPGDVVELHDTVLMVAPKKLVDKYRQRTLAEANGRAYRQNLDQYKDEVTAQGGRAVVHAGGLDPKRKT